MDSTQNSYSSVALVEWIYARAAPAHAAALFEANVAPLAIVLVSSAGEPPFRHDAGTVGRHSTPTKARLRGRDKDLARACRVAAAALTACPSTRSPSIFLRVP